MAEANDKESRSGEWARRYPPLLTMLVALILAVVVLPSSLNLPQTNPTQTLEFAPVPPDDKNDNQQGNTSALGAGDSSTIGADGLGGDGNGPTKPPPPDTGSGHPKDDGTACVGKPPRQTLDPLAPPCVPYWDNTADNGGATYVGVTATEVRVLMAVEGGLNYINASDSSNRSAPTHQIYDLAETEEQCRVHHKADSSGAGCTHLVTQGFRTWQKYFNDRFQTYGRFIHFFVAYSGGGDSTPDLRRAEAALHLKAVDPFAVVSFLTAGAEDDYLRAMARKGVLNFGSFGLRDKQFYNDFPALIWSYLPSIEQYSTSYINYICNQVVGNTANLAGGELANQPRKLGMISTNNPFQQGLVKLAALVNKGVTDSDCGGQIVDHAEFKTCCYARDNGDSPDDEQQQMASFQSQGITTILWPGGGNANYAQSAKALNYVPEWIVAGGDGFQDNSNYLFYSQGESVYDGHAVAISPHPLEPPLDQQLCYQAFREANTAYARGDLGYVCDYYKNIFQLFTGIQVAGPYLGPSQVNKGFHAIPQRATSTDPRVPACFYLQDDYTCVKDAVPLMYDAKGQQTGTSTPGCYRVINNGKRYLPLEWPRQQVAADYSPNDPCTGYSEPVVTKPT